MRSPLPLLTDVFYDLRDRRLLPVAFLLLVALLAAPILISKSSSEAPPPNVAAQDTGVDDAPEAQAAVVAESPRLRDYRERLKDLKPHNPFRQQFLPEPPAEDSGSSGSASSSTSDNESTSSGSTGSTQTGSGSTGTGSGSTGSGSGSTSPELKLISYKLDVLAGPAGNTREIKNVEPLQFLPGKQKPVIEFLAVDLSGKQATFAVSLAVSHAKGDGQCLADRENCEFLILKEGQAERLDYEVDGQTYRIKLLKIKQVVQDADKVFEAANAKGAKLKPWGGEFRS